jgi:hypothetical protein
VTAPAQIVSEFRGQRDLEVLAWPALDDAGAAAIVTTTRGGVSAGPYATLNLSLSVGDDPAAVLENRRRVAAAMDTELDSFVFARQVHSGAARVVTAADRGRGTLNVEDAVPDTDALVTADPRVTLAILAADCVPVLLCDPAAQVLACVHAGWRGTVAGVTGAALDAMADLGASADRVLAAIGPAIAASRYQVGGEVAEQVRDCLGEDSGVLRPDGTGRWLLDLPAANRLLLQRAGVPGGQIHSTPAVTGPSRAAGGDEREDGMFFSDRTARPCGRLALVARLTGTGGAGQGRQR